MDTIKINGFGKFGIISSWALPFLWYSIAMMNQKQYIIFLLACLLLPAQVVHGDSLHKSAVFGDAIAQYTLGVRYYHGDRETPKDYQKAMRYLTKATSQGHAKATVLLANIYLNGYGVEKNPDLSYLLVHAAAWKGYPNAQAILATYYCEGIGVEKDITKCCAWYDMAAAQGVEEAKQALTETVQKMSPQQIETATNISKNLWRQIVEVKSQ